MRAKGTISERKRMQRDSGGQLDSPRLHHYTMLGLDDFLRWQLEIDPD